MKYVDCIMSLLYYVLTVLKKVIWCAGCILLLVGDESQARVQPVDIQIIYFCTSKTLRQKANGIGIPFPLQLQGGKPKVNQLMVVLYGRHQSATTSKTNWNWIFPADGVYFVSNCISTYLAHDIYQFPHVTLVAYQRIVVESHVAYALNPEDRVLADAV